jgi:uncharacterized protein (TIRG00374 family)
MSNEAWAAPLPAPIQPQPTIHRRLWKLRYLLWLAIPLLLVWGLRQIPLGDIWVALSRLGPGSILALLLFNSVIFLLFSSRWWLILRAQGHRLPYLALVKYRLAAFAISYFSPGTQFGGEPLQVYMVHHRHAVPGLVSVAAVTLDKLFEMLANLTFLLVGLLVVLDQNLLASHGWPVSLLAIGGLLALPLGYLPALWLGRFPLTGMVLRLPARLAGSAWLRKLSPAIVSTERQMATLLQRHPLLILWALLLSGLNWLLILAEYWLTLRFLGQPLTLLQTISVLTAARLAFLLPLPGGLGALEASQVLVMQALGLDPALGISASLLIRARDLSFGALGLVLAAAYTRQATVRPDLTPQPPFPFREGGQGGRSKSIGVLNWYKKMYIRRQL